MNFAGIKIGHATDHDHHTGCTVFLCPDKTVASVDVRGSGPGTREAALLAPDKHVQHVNAVTLSGGSAFGLATADGVMRYLAEKEIGYTTSIRPIPIVPAAIVYDLFLGGGLRPPDAEMGYQACLDAIRRSSEAAQPQGNVGAGTGVTVGKWSGLSTMMKGGFGLAQETVRGVEVGAAAVVNAGGDVLNADGTVLAGARSRAGEWLVEQNRFRLFPDMLQDEDELEIGRNTTLVVVATNASLSKIDCNRLAQRAHDGMAIAIRPVHTTRDGDAAFALATGRLDQSPFDLVANIAVEMVAEAIRNAVRHATTVAGVPGLAD